MDSRDLFQDTYGRSSTPPARPGAETHDPFARSYRYTEGASTLHVDTDRVHMNGLSALESPPGDSVSVVADRQAALYEAAAMGEAPEQASLYDMAQQRQRDNLYRDDLEERYIRTQADNEGLQQTIERLKGEVETAERETDSFKGRWKVADANHRAEAERHKATKEELRAVKLHLQQGRSQYAHELRKRELEHGRLKDRLQKAMQDRYRTGKVGMKALNGKDINPIASQFRPTADKNEEFFRHTLEQAREKEGSIVTENDRLRRILITALREMESLLVVGRGEDIDLDGGVVEGIDPAIPDQVAESRKYALALAADRLGDGSHAQAEVVQLLRDIRLQYEHLVLQAQAPADAEILAMKEDALAEREEEILLLRKQSEEYKYVIEEQGKLIEMTLSPAFLANRPSTTTGGVMDSEGDAMMEDGGDPRPLADQRAQLEADRRKFAEAAVKVSKEREALHFERAAIEEERRNRARGDTFPSLSDTPAWMQDPPMRLGYAEGTTASSALRQHMLQQDHARPYGR